MKKTVSFGVLKVFVPLLMTFLAVSVFCSVESLQAKTTIKFALVTPEGSTWTKTVRDLRRVVKAETKGEVDFKIYPGGIAGDEVDVLRKMRINKIHAGGFSGVGLGIILPEIRILEAPMLFRDHAQLDRVKKHFFDYFAKAFHKKGYELLGFAEAGFVNLFSSQPLNTLEDLKKTKMWVWKGDTLAQLFLSSFGLSTTPLHLAQVNTGLETGMIDSFYAPPLAAMAFQWYAKAKYILDYPFVISIGAMLIKTKTMNKLSKKNQLILRQQSRIYCQKLVQATRRDNHEAKKEMVTSGIKIVTPSAADLLKYKQHAEKTYRASIPKFYSKSLLQRVLTVAHDPNKIK